MNTDAAIFANGARRLLPAPKGRRIFEQGDPVTAIYQVERGCVRLQMHDPDGSRDVLAFFFPGDVICGGLGTHWASAEAVSDSTLNKLSLSALHELMRSEPNAAIALLEAAEGALNDLAHHVGRIVHYTAVARLTWFLQWVATRTGRQSDAAFDLPMDRRDIADFLGLAPETVSRVFAQLEACGRLQKRSHRRYAYSDRSARAECESLDAAAAPAAAAA